MNVRMQAVRNALNRSANEQFKYGTLDCCLFAGEVVKELTGSNPMEQFMYNDETEAHRLISLWGGSLERAAEKLLGESVDVDELEVGDVILARVNQVDIVGVMLIDEGILKTANGTVKVPKRLIVKGWKIATSCCGIC